MSRGRRVVLGVICAGTLLLVPAQAAWAHAALLRTSPQASGTVNGSPARVSLGFSEVVEPKFAIISVTDAAGHQQVSGSRYRLPTDPSTLAVPVRHLPAGWYLVYWRVISADGHPVRGAFTFAVGPNPGPAPQFVIPSLSETAATPSLVAARWAAFISMMLALGLFGLRTFIARPAVSEAAGAARAVSVALSVALAAALVAIPIYTVMTTASFALRSALDVTAIVPLVRSSSLGRSFTDLELVVALFAIAAAVSIRLDRAPGRPRSVAALLAWIGALLAAAAMLAVPGLAGHAAQNSPAALSLALDWVHLAAGSLWLGGLVGLLVFATRLPAGRRRDLLAIVVSRFSRLAMLSVAALIASGVGASLQHLPTLPSLWQTSYGQAILVKVALLSAALVLGAINFSRTAPRLVAARSRRDAVLGDSAAALLRRTLTGEVVLVTAIVAAAMVLSSLPPPAKALGQLGHVSAHVGPGRVTETVKHGGYSLGISITPNRAASPSQFSVTIIRGGQPVTGATVIAHFAMLDMEMGQQAYTLTESPPGTYTRSAPALVMAGHWGLSFDVEPTGAAPFTVILVDKAEG
ncbi:MAG: copper transport protein [Gaiellales bacterium]|nr:copper transport protein [Gaiellales bacterium]